MKYLLSFFLCLVLFSSNSIAQKSTALILIDIQDFYFPGGKVELVDAEKAGKQAKQLLHHFRENKDLVIHVRHNFQPGGDIHDLVEPIKGEKIISKDEVNAFLNTDLNDYLRKNNIKEIVLCGMQTHMCLEGGTRAAHDLDYSCTVISDACATRDLKMGESLILAKDVHLSTLSTLKSYAKVLTLEEYIK